MKYFMFFLFTALHIGVYSFFRVMGAESEINLTVLWLALFMSWGVLVASDLLKA
jgi:hypothetical protein